MSDNDSAFLRVGGKRPRGRRVGTIHDLADELGGDAADAWNAVVRGGYFAWRASSADRWTIFTLFKE